MSDDTDDDDVTADINDMLDAKRWQTFDRLLAELIDDYVHGPAQAARAEQELQKRAQDMRELYESSDHGRHQ